RLAAGTALVDRRDAGQGDRAFTSRSIGTPRLADGPSSPGEAYELRSASSGCDRESCDGGAGDALRSRRRDRSTAPMARASAELAGRELRRAAFLPPRRRGVR